MSGWPLVGHSLRHSTKLALYLELEKGQIVSRLIAPEGSMNSATAVSEADARFATIRFKVWATRSQPIAVTFAD